MMHEVTADNTPVFQNGNPKDLWRWLRLPLHRVSAQPEPLGEGMAPVWNHWAIPPIGLADSALVMTTIQT